MNITIYNRDELFLINIESVIYLKAEDHYTRIHYTNGTRLLVPFGLSKLCELFAQHIDFDSYFLHAGRSYIISLRHLCFISSIKEQIGFNGSHDRHIIIQMSRPLLKEVIKEMKRLEEAKEHQPTKRNIQQ